MVTNLKIQPWWLWWLMISSVFAPQLKRQPDLVPRLSPLTLVRSIHAVWISGLYQNQHRRPSIWWLSQIPSQATAIFKTSWFRTLLFALLFYSASFIWRFANSLALESQWQCWKISWGLVMVHSWQHKILPKLLPFHPHITTSLM